MKNKLVQTLDEVLHTLELDIKDTEDTIDVLNEKPILESDVKLYEKQLKKLKDKQANLLKIKELVLEKTEKKKQTLDEVLKKYGKKKSNYFGVSYILTGKGKVFSEDGDYEFKTMEYLPPENKGDNACLYAEGTTYELYGYTFSLDGKKLTIDLEGSDKITFTIK